MGWATGGILVVGKSCPAPVPCGPISRLTLKGRAGYRGARGWGVDGGVASTLRPVIMLPTFPRLDQTRSFSSPGPSCVNQIAHGEAWAVYWSATHTHVLSSRLYQMDIVRSLLTRLE